MMGIRAEGAFANAGRTTTDFVDVSASGEVSVTCDASVPRCTSTHERAQICDSR